MSHVKQDGGNIRIYTRMNGDKTKLCRIQKMGSGLFEFAYFAHAHTNATKPTQQVKPVQRGLVNNNEPYQCYQSDAQKNGEASECFLQVCQDVAALPRHTIIEQGEGEAIEVAEAVLVWVVAVVPSALTAHPQMPLTCREEGARLV